MWWREGFFFYFDNLRFADQISAAHGKMNLHRKIMKLKIEFRTEHSLENEIQEK